MMYTPVSNFDRFRNALQEAAAHALERIHPEYVAAFQRTLSHTGDFSKAIDAVKDIPTDKGFAKWRPLLTATLDVELAISQVGNALNLLKILPTKEVIGMSSISQGAWVQYHWMAWTFWMDALLEREKKLVKRTVRALVRPNNTKFRDIENSLLKPINALSEHMGKARDPLAHAGGAMGALTQKRLWEGTVLLGVSLGIHQLFEQEREFHGAWYTRLRDVSELALHEIERVFEELNCYIEWDNV